MPDEKKYSFEFDMHQRGSNGFKRLDAKGKETIRSLEIPTCSKKTERIKSLLSKKPRKTK